MLREFRADFPSLRGTHSAKRRPCDDLKCQEPEHLDFIPKNDLDVIALELHIERRALLMVLPDHMAILRTESPDTQIPAFLAAKSARADREKEFSFHPREITAGIDAPFDLARGAIHFVNHDAAALGNINLPR